jgi:hypothetical protein
MSRPNREGSTAGGDRNRRIAVIAFAVAVLVIAGLGFVYKMTEFATTIIKDDVEGFGAVAVSIYLIGMLPIVFLTLWAVLSGRFRDIGSQYRMLELDREIVRRRDRIAGAGMEETRPPADKPSSRAQPGSASRPDTPLDGATTSTRAIRCRGGSRWCGSFLIFGVTHRS